MSYRIKRYTYNQAEKLGVQVKPSRTKGKKIDVFKKGIKVASVGALGMNDYPTYLEKEKKGIVSEGTAGRRRKAYKIRHENSPLLPQSSYETSKLWGENIVSRRESHVILRFSSVFGAGMKEHTVLPTYINQALSTGKIEVWGRGERKQNYVHVEDACSYIQRAVWNLKKIKGRKLLAVGQRHVSNKQLAEIIARHTGAKIIFKNTDTSHSRRYDNQVTRKILGYRFGCSLEQQVREFIEWKKGQS